MFKSLQTFADSVADGANKLAEQARDGLHSAAEAAAALDAQLKAATSAPGTPNAKEKKGEGDAGSGWTTRETSPARSLNPPSPVKLGRSSVEAAAASVPETARHASGPSLAG